MKHSEITILILRITVALFFIMHGVRKMESGWITSNERLNSVLSNYHDNASGFHKTYLEKVAIPYSGIWSPFIAFGETALGISLLIGLLTNVSLIAGMLMALSFNIANGNMFSTDLLYDPYGLLTIVALLVLFIAKCGYEYGFDGMVSVKVGKRKGGGAKNKKVN